MQVGVRTVTTGNQVTYTAKSMTGVDGDGKPVEVKNVNETFDLDSKL